MDTATCLGIYFDEVSGALISHGEMEIARLSADESIVWRTVGPMFSLRDLPFILSSSKSSTSMERPTGFAAKTDSQSHFD